MFLPQRPYIPIGSLRRAATYPEAADSRSAEHVAEAFGRVGLLRQLFRAVRSTTLLSYWESKVAEDEGASSRPRLRVLQEPARASDG